MKNQDSHLDHPTAWSASWLAIWLAVGLIACKGVLLGRPSDGSVADVIDFVRDLGIMSHADVLFAMVAGAGCGVATRFARRAVGRRRTAIQIPMVCAFVLSAAYGIASVQVFAYLRSHLTYPLIYLAGDMKNMRSSLGAFVTPTMFVALIIGPLMYLVLVWLSQRLIQVRRTRWIRAGQVIGFVVILLYVAWGHHGYSTLPWCDRVDRRVAENPHWVLVKSLVTDLTSEGQRIQLAENFAPEMLADFETVAERRPAGWARRGQDVRGGKDEVHVASDSLPTSWVVGRPAWAAVRSAIDRSTMNPDSAGVARPKNVIVYVLESVGAQHLGLYDSLYDTTPCLEREAANSLVFDNFYAHCGVTANSLVAINLGIYPGLTWREYTVEQPDLPGTTVAQLVKQRGYRTAYITSGEIEYVNMDGFLRDRGYDDVWGYSYLPCKELIISWGVEDRCLVDGALDWIDRDSAEPFFLMVWTQQTHHPYEPSPSVPFINFFEGLSKDELPPDDYDLGRYLNVVREADRQLGRLFDGLRRRGLADDTLVVVTGDHGEGFGSPHDIYGHGGKVFDEIVKVPLVLWNPRLFGKKGSGVFDADGREGAAHQRVPTPFSGGQRVGTMGGHIDLNPTIAELLGIPTAGSWQGRSLFAPDRPPRVYFYAANDDYLLGVRERGEKYIYNATIGRERLFDLDADPREQTNLALSEPERCGELRSRLAAWVKYEKGHIAKLRDQVPARRAVAAGVAHGAER
jgi:arylsulfatase A-like enzyme